MPLLRKRLIARYFSPLSFDSGIYSRANLINNYFTLFCSLETTGYLSFDRRSTTLTYDYLGFSSGLKVRNLS